MAAARTWGLYKSLLFLTCLLPLASLIWRLQADQLGPDPAETLVQALGQWGFRLLLLTLAVSPLRRLAGWSWPLRFRRMLGLYAFFYLCLHLSAYAGLLLGWSLQELINDFAKRPYISVGILAFALLLPLALTSTRAMVRRLGRRWQSLHRLVYPASVFGLVHLCWQVRSDYGEALLYGLVLLLLLMLRLPSPPRLRARARS